MNITQLKNYFSSVERWPDSIRFDDCSTTNKVKQTVNSHISILEANSGKPRFEPYYNRLMKVFGIMNTGEPNIQDFLKQSKPIK